MSQVAKRYADALFLLAGEKQIVADVNADLEELVKVIETTPELLSLLDSPKFSIERKKQIVAEIFANANEFVINTLVLLIEKKRVNEIKALAQEFKVLAAEAQGSADAKVYSTRELTDAEKDEISTAFGKLVGKGKLNITNVIEPSLLGGVRVQIGNYIFDNTVANKLEGLKRTLVG
ncbi:F0F1 ATP synthase subunit delta [Lysinibacillus sp. BW-2-10]|uniref:F0F1 ATP synthase subunit delta n=1 Tax=Lysinibacillus sp. BW-2-10 TaxID=2590030 RepID=UPI00117CEDEE|nr:F0F1 ATP synthase subunit delta [Lysinibacillus sp. BW-2-10]TSI07426.1 F0F1 ATP synthase subunit delta [Lysinibacillus sp. BW-2-10]